MPPFELARRCGVLLHPTSLPGRSAVGDLGEEAYTFVDFLASAGQSVWQVLPLGPTGVSNSPYDSRSAFAGNPLLIAEEWLLDHGLLSVDDVPPEVEPTERADFDRARARKGYSLQMSFARFEAAPEHLLAARFEAFRQREAYWLDDFALYQSIRDANDGLPWTAWPDDIMRGDPGGRERWRTALADKVRFHEFVQFLFDEQWHELRLFADRRGVRILGDIPIYVSLDSADVWANQHLFALDLRGSPTVVAGVPPDYFSAAGQLWGNPCYLWRDMKNDKYRWWIERFRRMFELSDIARVDHFRAFQAGWQVDAGEESAINGRWVEGPGEDLFDCVERSLGPLEIVVEDLGIITDDVKALRDRLGFPGMKVLQFAFGGQNDNPYLPHNFDANCVVYTGTHDNDTTAGWFERSDARTRDHVERYLGHLPDEMHWAMIRLAYASVASTVIVPAQDLLGLGSEHRMNIPGTPHGNWEWRAMPGAFSSTIADRLRELATTYRRMVQAGV